MINELLFEQDARKKIKAGINTVAEAVKSTLGPKGKCVVIKDLNGKIKLTKDGVSVAKEINLSDSFEDTGAQLIKQAAIKTLTAVGDATTTSTILAQDLINRGDEVLTDSNFPKLQQGISLGLERALEYIKKEARPIEQDDLQNVATVSANNDYEIGEIIARAFKKIGKDGVISVDESTNYQTYVDVTTGMQFDKGYISNHFVTDVIKDTCILENPYILITEEKITKMSSIASLLNEVASENKAILLIASDYSENVLEALRLNVLNGVIKLCAVKTPTFGEYRKAFLQDIAILTKGRSINYDMGLEIEDITISDLGQCKKVIVNKDTTTIIGGEGDIDNRVKELKEDLARIKADATMDGSFMIDFLNQRIAKLTGGIARIYVGGTTELELKERKDRVEDAVAATKAAIEEGIVVGGGLTYYNIYNYLDQNYPSDLDVKLGYEIFRNALLAPLHQLFKNNGIVTEKEIEKYTSQFTDKIGYDAKNNLITDLYRSGIIDPAKAAKHALKNAVSVANLYLSISCVISPIIVQ